MKKTTLIIGAGVNKEINNGIDLGAELLQDISDRVTDRTSTNKKYLSNLLNQLNLAESLRERFVKDIDRYKVYYEYASIDDFLYKIETLSEFTNCRIGYLQIAKISIIFHVLGFEGTETQKNITNDIKNQATWLSMVCKHINRDIFNSQNEALNIVTFNYDRILEEYLLEAFSSDIKILDFIDNNIFHVYGRIGCLDKLILKKVDEKIIPFGFPNNRIHEINQLVNHIKLIYEEREINPQIKKIIKDSDEVLIMGYGFDYINNIKIALDDTKDGSKVRVAVHSPLDNHTEQKIKTFISNALIENCSCYDFLNHYW